MYAHERGFGRYRLSRRQHTYFLLFIHSSSERICTECRVSPLSFSLMNQRFLCQIRFSIGGVIPYVLEEYVNRV